MTIITKRFSHMVLKYAWLNGVNYSNAQFAFVTWFIRSGSSSIIHFVHTKQYIHILSHSMFILQSVHFTDLLRKYKIFQIQITKSSMFLYKSWLSTISVNICHSIHFTDIFKKCKIYKMQNFWFFVSIFFSYVFFIS